MISDAAYSLRPALERNLAATPEPATEESHARPIPRVNIQAFCEDQETASAIQKAFEDLFWNAVFL